MVTRDTAWGDGTPCWVDLGVADIAKAGAFYGALFGWEVHQGPPEVGGYALCLKDGKLVAGIGPKMGPAGESSTWTTYLAASDADATAGTRPSTTPCSATSTAISATAGSATPR